MKLSKAYVNYLKDRFYKCLCLFEEENEELSSYINSFMYELYSLEHFVDNEKNSHIPNLLVSILKHFHDDSLLPNPDIAQIRSETFRCIRLVGSLIEVGEK